MDKDVLLGELKEFKRETISRLKHIEKKVDDLDEFKIKLSVSMFFILGVIEIGFKLASAIR